MAASVPLEGLHGALLALRGRERLQVAEVPPLARARVLHARVETELARLELPDHAGKLLIGAVARHPASPAESLLTAGNAIPCRAENVRGPCYGARHVRGVHRA